MLKQFSWFLKHFNSLLYFKLFKKFKLQPLRIQEHLYHSTPSQGSGIIERGGRGQKQQNNWGRLLFIRKLFSGHSRAAVHRNSQWLWQHAQDLCKLKPEKNSKPGGWGGYTFPPPAVQTLAQGHSRVLKPLLLGSQAIWRHMYFVSCSVPLGLRNVYWFRIKHTKLYRNKQNLQFQSMRLSAWKSLGPVGNVI